VTRILSLLADAESAARRIRERAALEAPISLADLDEALAGIRAEAERKRGRKGKGR
jgi:hypothetical protein